MDGTCGVRFDATPQPVDDEERVEIMPCTGCIADPNPNYVVIPRTCAFGDDGLFRSVNWNCVTINAFREMLPDDDEDTKYSSFKNEDDLNGSFGAFGIPRGSNEIVQHEEPDDNTISLVGYVAMAYDSERPIAKSVMLMSEAFAARRIQLREAEAILQAARFNFEAQGRHRAINDHADPIIVAWRDACRLTNVEDVANGLAHLASRVRHLKRPLTATLAIEIMADQFSSEKLPEVERYLAYATTPKQKAHVRSPRTKRRIAAGIAKGSTGNPSRIEGESTKNACS